MAYSIPWDESDPPGATTPADTIDTEIQETKISIRERLEDFVPDWSDDLVQPKRILPSVAKVEKTSDQSIPASTVTELVWEAEVFDPDTPTSDPNGLFDSGVSDEIFTIIRDGYYSITTDLRIDDLGAGATWTIRIVKNGTVVIHSAIYPGNTGVTPRNLGLSTLVELVDGDTVEIEVNQTDSVARDVKAGSEFWIHMVNNL